MDIEYLLILQNVREFLGETFTSFAENITAFGEDIYWLPIVACIIWCGYKELGHKMLFSYGLARTANSFLKITACVSRPWLTDPRVIPDKTAIISATGYSFPSGHTATATAFFGTIGLSFRKYKSVLIPCFIGIAAVMFSRNYLGVHTPQDVIVSFIISLPLVLAAGKLYDLSQKGSIKLLLVAGSSLLFCLALILYSALKPYPETFADGSVTNAAAMAADGFKNAGRFAGFIIGYVLETKLIKYEAPKTLRSKILTCVYGIIIFTVTNALLSLALSGITIAYSSWLVGFITNFWKIFFIVAVYPLIAKKPRGN